MAKQNKMSIRRGDTVKVLKKARTKARPARCCARSREVPRCRREKVNMVKKAMRPTQARTPRAAFHRRGAHPRVQRDARVPQLAVRRLASRKRFTDEGKKVRVCKKCGKDIVNKDDK